MLRPINFVIANNFFAKNSLLGEASDLQKSGSMVAGGANFFIFRFSAKCVQFYGVKIVVLSYVHLCLLKGRNM